MTKNEAIAAMRTGKRVTHAFYLENEWITMDSDSNIVTEDGHTISDTEFWSYRKGIEWERSWSLWSLQKDDKVKGSMLERALLTLDDYLNAGCKETRKKAAENAKFLYKEYYGIDYVNRNERK